ncbi:NAD(P)-dependent oxidoreductase [Cellulomonas sp. URHE0023]|uniref:NAD-dependent epimerase/dehydratase family protein n=1 Tax=Cellulomonas sp. URHE0023 TaxID=1380354 RepID=UPI0009E0B103|nr:NAD(P)-dependent oxidoreductase [Cellulomonas sp. URHE0023]
MNGAPLELVTRVLRSVSGPVAVTGATGWLGGVATSLLYRALGDDASHRVLPFASRATQITVDDGRTVDVLPLASLPTAEARPEVVLHFAFVTRSRLAQLGHPEFIRQNLSVTATVLEAIARHRPRATVVASSGAVYAPDRFLQTDLAAEPYGTLKYLDELAFRSAVADTGGSLAVPRIFSVAAASTPHPDTYALGNMITMAQAGSPIDIRARGPVRRAFCGVDEVIALALWAATGRPGTTTFDTSGEPTELGELAHVVARVNARTPDAIVREFDASLAEDDYTGDSTAMRGFAREAGMRLRSLEELVQLASDGLRLSARPGYPKVVAPQPGDHAVR